MNEAEYKNLIKLLVSPNPDNNQLAEQLMSGMLEAAGFRVDLPDFRRERSVMEAWFMRKVSGKLPHLDFQMVVFSELVIVDVRVGVPKAMGKTNVTTPVTALHFMASRLWARRGFTELFRQDMEHPVSAVAKEIELQCFETMTGMHEFKIAGEL